MKLNLTAQTGQYSSHWEELKADQRQPGNRS